MCTYFHVDHIYALLPRVELYSKPFDQWSADDWNDQENLSAPWDIKAGQVLWARGVRDIDWVRQNGQAPEAFLDANEA